MALAKSASHDVIASEQEFADLIRQIQAADRVAIDTEADSLHSYREKLCLLQISAPAVAGIVDGGLEQGEFASQRLSSDPASSTILLSIRLS